MSKINEIGELLRNPENRCREHSRNWTADGTQQYCLIGAINMIYWGSCVPNDVWYTILHDILGYRDATSAAAVWDLATDHEQDIMVERLLNYDESRFDY